VHVVAETPAPIASPIVGADFKHAEIEALATPRTIQGIAQLAPAVNENGPNAQTVVINGAFSFDNVFMVNGVDINDNLFAQPQNLFIEDAIEETQVLTSGISAEYGRFSGGVINAITKSGGNTFSGSGRVNFLNPAWTTQTPFEVSRGTSHLDVLSRTYEGTFGGPIVKDRLWFFTSGRYAKTNNQVTLQQTGLGLLNVDTNKRGELKFTGTVAQNHTIQGGFLTDPRTRTNNSGLQSFIIDPHSEVTRSNPNWYYFTNYRGVFQSNVLVEAQYSERRFEFEGDGGTSTNIQDSPFISVTQCACLFNAPYFDATDPEHRNNRQLTGSVTDYWAFHGRHETKAGFEWFRSQRTGGNSQSSTSYVFNSDFATDANGIPLLDSSGRPVPLFVSGLSSIDYFPATRGGTSRPARRDSVPATRSMAGERSHSTTRPANGPAARAMAPGPLARSSSVSSLTGSSRSSTRWRVSPSVSSGHSAYDVARASNALRRSLASGGFMIMLASGGFMIMLASGGFMMSLASGGFMMSLASGSLPISDTSSRARPSGGRAAHPPPAPTGALPSR